MNDDNKVGARMTGHPAVTEPLPNRSDASIAMGWLKALSLPLLLLWTPFIIFLTDNQYSLFAPEVLVSLGGLTVLAGLVAFLRMMKQPLWYAMAIAGLLTVFIDFQFEWMVGADKYVALGLVVVATVLVVKWQEAVTLMMTAVFATMLGTAVVQSVFQSPATRHLVPDGASAARHAPPRLIHLVLDEHIGIAGLPTHFELGRTVQDRLLRFYQRHGFLVYGGAYSHYFSTFDSLPNLVNFSTESKEKAFVVDKKPPLPLIKNRYFEILSQRQYRLHVLGAGHIDFCADETVALQTCRQYHYAALGSLGNQHDSLALKVPAIVATYLTKYHRYQQLLSAYQDPIQPSLASKGILLPTLPSDSLWTTGRLRPISANAMALIEDLWDNILKLPRGHALFAHVMLPHYPYIYREDCTARPMTEWRNGLHGMPTQSRTDDFRNEFYGLYLQQVQCLYTKLDVLFNRMRAAGMLEDSIIIIHGDHGSRLGLHDPYVVPFNVLTERDYSDAFSTLFAVKLPGKQAGFDPSPRALEELLAEVLAIPLQTAPAGSSKPSEPFVYFSAGNRTDFVVRYPLLGHIGPRVHVSLDRNQEGQQLAQDLAHL